MRQLIVLGSILMAVALLGISLWVLGEDESDLAGAGTEVVDVSPRPVQAQPVDITALPAGEGGIPVTELEEYRGDGRLFGTLSDFEGEPVANGEVLIYASVTADLGAMAAQHGGIEQAEMRFLMADLVRARRQQSGGQAVTWGPRRIRRAITDEDGRYRITDLAAGTYVIDAHDGTYSLASPRSVSVPEDGPGLEVDLALAKGVRLSVSVRDTFGRPVPEAQVIVSVGQSLVAEVDDPADHPALGDPVGVRKARTDDDGFARFVGLRQGSTYVPTAECKGYYLAENVPPQIVQRDTTLTIQLGSFSVLAGVVIAPDGQPAADAKVHIEGQSVATTDDQGNFRLDDIQVGDGPLTLLAATEDLDGIGRETIELAQGEKREDLRILLQRSARIRGRVIDRRGLPIAGARVWAQKRADPAAVEARNLHVQDDLLRLAQESSRGDRSSSWLPLSEPPEEELFDSAEETTEIFELEVEDSSVGSSGVVMRSNGTSFRLNVPVVQFAESLQIQSSMDLNAMLSSRTSLQVQRGVLGSGESVETDENGEYEILGLWPGTYGVSASAEDYLPIEEPVEVELPVMGSEGRADFELTRGARVEGITYGPNGLPRSGIDVFFLRGTDYVATVTSDEEGRYRATGLPEASYDVYARSGGYEILAQRKELWLQVEQDYSGLDLHLLPGGRITGLVTDLAGRPIAGAQVQVTTTLEGQVTRSAQSDEAGQFVVENLYDGEYRITATANDYLPETVEGLAVQRGEVLAQDLRLSMGGVLAGRVIDESGLPISGVNVFLHRGKDRQVVSTDERGEYRFSRIEAGPCRVFARTDDYRRNAYREVTLSHEEEVAGFDIRLDDAARATGRVLGKGGPAPAGLTVQARSLPDGHVTRTGQTDAQGRFLIENLYQGRYRVFVVGHEQGATELTVDPGGEATGLTISYDG